ncbi:ferric reductase [Alternaria alternata]|jgi:predicted ferric reductase|nr:ferric reductase [Alternaria alternata]
MDDTTTQNPSSPSDILPFDNLHNDKIDTSSESLKFSQGLAGVDQTTNYMFVNILIITALFPILIALCFRVFVAARNDRRRISAIASCRGQELWARDRYVYWGALKRHFLYAPVGPTKCRQPAKGSTGGTTSAPLPTRVHSLVIVVYILSNMAYCLVVSVRSRPQMVAEFRGRCGTLATFNLIFAVLFALRNNPLINLLHVSYDTFNLFHRWTARLVVVEATAHAAAFLYNTYRATHDGKSGWHSVGWLLKQSLSYQCGLAAFVAFLFLIIHSIGPIRRSFYETFLSLHRIGLAVAVSGVYFHLAKHALPQLPWVYLVIIFLSLEPSIRIVRILRYNFSWKEKKWTLVGLESLPGEATRVTFTLPHSWNANPGSHVQIYMPRIALMGSHPFSVAWSQSSGDANALAEKAPFSIDDLDSESGPSTISCVIRSRQGMTSSFYKLAARYQDAQVHLWGAIEGPYGGYHSLDSYGTVVLFAGGVGITHQLSFVRHLLNAHNSNIAATQKISLVWCIASLDALEWVRSWLDEIAAIQHFREVVSIRLYISRMVSFEFGGRSIPAYLEVRLQRCEVQSVLDGEVLAQIGAMAVSVCGPRGFSDSVRAAVRRRVSVRSIDLFEEAFSY